MMTVAMDRTLTAPAPPARSPGAPRAADPRRADPRRAAAATAAATDAGRTPAVPPSRRAARSADGPVYRLVAGVLLGAVLMFGVAVLDTFADTTVPVLGSFAALPAGTGDREVVEVPAPPADPGTCLNWTRADAADAEVVDCSQPHLFEQAGSVALTDQRTLPDERGFRQLVNERCNPVVLGYLGGRFDPDGRYRVGALKPSPVKWAAGDRDLRCGLQRSSRSGVMFATTGTVAESDQAAVQEPGTCLGIDGRTIGDPVSCAQPHAVETVGIVDLAGKFPDEFPAVGEQDAFLQPECTRLAGEFAGDPAAISAKNLTVYWDNLGEQSWQVGTRRVNCNLAALLPDRSGFAPVTGSVRDETVVVSDTPAPSVPENPDPVPPVQAPAEPPPAPAPPPPAEPAPAPAPELPPPPADPLAPPTPGEAPVPLPPPDGLPTPTLPDDGT